jgi:hypothetical protein
MIESIYIYFIQISHEHRAIKFSYSSTKMVHKKKASRKLADLFGNAKTPQ